MSEAAEAKSSPAVRVLKTLQRSPNGTHLVGTKHTPARVLTGKRASHVSNTKQPMSSKANVERKPAHVVTQNVASTNDIRFERGTNTEPVEVQTMATNTEAVEMVSDQPADVIRMLTQPQPTGRYWQMLAEERCKALQEALGENEQLWDQIRRLQGEVAQLRRTVNWANEIFDELKINLETEVATPAGGD